jgi:hypothetical protein
MTRRELKIEFWVAVVLLSASVSGLGFLAFSVAHGRFPESLIPFVDAFYGTKENAAVAADLGTKLGVALVSALVARSRMLCSLLMRDEKTFGCR